MLQCVVASTSGMEPSCIIINYPIRHHETFENLPWMQPEAQWPHVHRSQATQWHPHWPNDHRIDPVLLWKQKDSGRSTWPDQQTFSIALRCVFTNIILKVSQISASPECFVNDDGPAMPQLNSSWSSLQNTPISVTLHRSHIIQGHILR